MARLFITTSSGTRIGATTPNGRYGCNTAHIENYTKRYGVAEKAARPAPEFYKYYSTQRPIDIGAVPRTENATAEIVNFDKCESVENGGFDFLPPFNQ